MGDTPHTGDMHDQPLPPGTTLRGALSMLGRLWGAKRSKLSRMLGSKQGAERIWATRRLRYGPTGRRPVDVRLRRKLAETGSDKL